jgi:hypothetical protein
MAQEQLFILFKFPDENQTGKVVKQTKNDPQLIEA